jgi:hypothetical protein
MPRISVDLLNLDDAIQVNLEPAPGGTGIEEKVFFRLILVVWQPAIVKLLELAPIRISLAIDNLEFGFAGGIGFGWGRHAVKFEGPGCPLVLIMINLNPYFGVAHGT